jgi:hypothetical protein
MKFGTFLSDLAKKSGVDVTQKEFVDVLAHDIEIPDAIASTINKSLMNIEAAKNNPEVRKAARAEALNGVDSKITDLLEELGIEDASEILEEKNSYEKIAKLTRTVKALEEKKAKTAKTPEKEALEKKIDELNRELNAAKTNITKKEQEWQDLRDGDLTNFEIQKKLLGKDYALPKEMDADLKVTTAYSAINKALASKELKIVRENGQLIIKTKDNLKAYSDTNEELQLDSYIDGVLAQNKLLKVNDSNSEETGKNQQTVPAGGGEKGNMQIVSDIESSLFK